MICMYVCIYSKLNTINTLRFFELLATARNLLAHVLASSAYIHTYIHTYINKEYPSLTTHTRAYIPDE